MPSGTPSRKKKQLESFYHALKTTINLPIFTIELTIYPDLPNHLNGTGMIIINPPYQFDEMIDQNLPWLWNALSINKQGAYKAFMLK